jgi:ribonuclease P protein component
MLKKSERIPRSLFGTLLTSDFKLNTKNFFIRVAPSADHARIAVSVSKKVSKKATVRNKIRRRAYSALQGEIKKLKPNMYLIVAKPGSDKIKGEALLSELQILQGAPKIVNRSKKS